MELAVRDIERAVEIDTNKDGKITWGELRAGGPRLRSLLGQHMDLSTRGAVCPLKFETLRVNERVDGNYAWLSFTARCSVAPDSLSVHYQVMDGVDPSHRGLFPWSPATSHKPAWWAERRAKSTSSSTAPRAGAPSSSTCGSASGISGAASTYLLFLLSLLLPAVLSRRNGRWGAVSSAKPAFLDILRVVTAFTAAHSITLTLAALNIVHLPSRLTESIIAASIIVAALNHISRRHRGTRADRLPRFGLLHVDSGFTSVLADAGPAGRRQVTVIVRLQPWHRNRSIGCRAGRHAGRLLDARRRVLPEQSHAIGLGRDSRTRIGLGGTAGVPPAG